jgi:hypothetical protein
VEKRFYAQYYSIPDSLRLSCQGFFSAVTVIAVTVTRMHIASVAFFIGWYLFFLDGVSVCMCVCVCARCVDRFVWGVLFYARFGKWEKLLAFVGGFFFSFFVDGIFLNRSFRSSLHSRLVFG